jgi:hypothetical protein
VDELETSNCTEKTVTIPATDREPEARNADTRALRGEAACAVGDPDWDKSPLPTEEEVVATIANVLHYAASEEYLVYSLLEKGIELFESDRA